MKHIIQSEASECGLASLAIVCSRLGAHFTLSELRARFPPPSRGQTLAQVMDVATALGLTVRAVRCDLEELRDLVCPAILHWEFNHYVVLVKVTRDTLVLEDPAVGRRVVSMEEASRCFTGVALEVGQSAKFAKRKSRPPLSVWTLLSWTPPIVSGLVQALLLSLVVQAFVLAAPFYMQLAIDEAALKGDVPLLNVLAMGFGLFALFNVGATFLRDVAAQRVTALLGWEMTVRLYRHLLKLPLRWFQKRRLADTLVRFESIEPIRQLVANGLVTSIIDGLLGITVFLMMFMFSPALAVIALVAFAVHAAVRWFTIPLSLRLASEELTAQISEQGKRIETLKAIQTIKALGAEGERERDWSAHYSEVIRKNQVHALSRVSIKGIQDGIEAVAYALLVFVAVQSVMAATLTVGGVFAFIAYRTQFQQRTTALFEAFVSWRMLDLHASRLAEIVLEPTEASGGKSNAIGSISGSIELTGVGFRYSPSEPMVFQNISLTIEPGEIVAFVGASGEGKSTLMKVLSGLYPATFGEIRLDGLPLETWGSHTVRRSIGMVLQDDELLSGTIADNVSFFDEQCDVPWVWECLKTASVAEEIAAMPMGIETFVGDMGSALSGGQKQRILLARALYRRPRILILDEATSHLDVKNEKSITTALNRLSITRLIVAHRRDTIAMADKVVSLQNGKATLFRHTAPVAAPVEA